MSKKQEKNNQPSDNASLPGATRVYGYQADQEALAQAEARVAPVWQVGDVLLDLYEVKEVFSSGGMGLVYRVHHRGWNTDLAVKSPRPEFFQSEAHRENFIREAETWVNLGLHPHMVSCYYVRTLGGIPRLFAEYVEGGSLKDWIDSRRLYEGGKEKALGRMLDIAIQMAWGLGYAHEQGVIHQDVKPANVMMTQDGTAKVTDFGMARARAAAGEAAVGGQSILVSSGGMTPAYCSPEQAAREKVTRRTDIWSWGVSMLEMFVGEVTWLAGQAAAEVLKGYLEGEGHENDLPAMPQDVVELLQRCFQADPAARPVDMAELTASLASIYEQTVGQPYPHPLRMPATAKLQADALNNRAISYLDLGRASEAQAAFEQALGVDPQHPEATYNAGLAAWRSGHITDDTLVTRLYAILASHPGDWRPFYLQALVHLERDDCQSALEVLGQIQDPDAVRAEVASARQFAQERLPHSRRLLHTFAGHTDGVYSVALSADGRLALSGGGESTLRLWDLATGECLLLFKGHAAAVDSVALSADGRLALSGSYDETLRLWELATGECRRTIEGHMAPVNSLALSADGHLALSGSNWDNTFRLWELATGECLRVFKGHKHNVLSVALSADSRLALSGSQDTTLRLWELATGECRRVFKGHPEAVTSVALSADGRLALSGSWDKTLRLWDVATGKCLRTFEGHMSSVESVTLSADGRLALSGSADKTLRLWDVATAECRHTFKGHTEYVNSVAISPDGSLALSGSSDKTLRLWQANCGESRFRASTIPARVLPTEAVLASQAAYDQALAEARQALAGGDAAAAARYVRAARSQPGFEHGVEAIKIWSTLSCRLPKGKPKDIAKTVVFKGNAEDALYSVALSADGCLALSGGGDGTLRLWELATGECLRLFKGHTSVVYSVALSVDGRLALSGSADKKLRLWDVATAECRHTFKGHTENVNSVALSADGRFALSGSDDETLRLWDVNTGQCLRTFEGHTAGLGVSSVALNADGRLALSGSRDKTLRLWELASGDCLRLFKGHTSWVDSLALSADGHFVLSGSDDCTVRLWELATGECLRLFKGHTAPVYSVALSADGHFALSGSDDCTVRLWELATGESACSSSRGTRKM